MKYEPRTHWFYSRFFDIDQSDTADPAINQNKKRPGRITPNAFDL
jgi:hypothetical protein